MKMALTTGFFAPIATLIACIPITFASVQNSSSPGGLWVLILPIGALAMVVTVGVRRSSKGELATIFENLERKTYEELQSLIDILCRKKANSVDEESVDSFIKAIDEAMLSTSELLEPICSAKTFYSSFCPRRELHHQCENLIGKLERFRWTLASEKTRLKEITSTEDLVFFQKGFEVQLDSVVSDISSK